MGRFFADVSGSAYIIQGLTKSLQYTGRCLFYPGGGGYEFLLECPVEFRTTEFRRNFTKFFDSAGIKLRNSVTFCGIPVYLEFRKILIPPEFFFFFDGTMNSLVFIQ